MGILRRSGAGSLDALVVGLGNPGPRYARTRHNLGFRVVELLGERAAASFRSKYNGRFAETRLGEARVGLLMPDTFMNLSGPPAATAARFYKLPPEAVIVVHDDVDVDFDRVRAKAGGGLKGHNGLRSLAEALGTREFTRVRLGVGRPRRGDAREVADFVLAPFEPDEDPEPMIERGADCVQRILDDGIEDAERAYP
jgi:peptidyl-tRNA hydrolase, PTH1 family